MTHAFSPAYSAAFDVSGPTQGSWQKLLDIKRQDEQEYADWLDEEPVACPNDGTPLDTGPGGVLHCPMGDWTRPGGTTNRFM